MAPYLSIVMPIYNTQKYLGKCIDSILGQEFMDYELILVDNGSTDKSPAICDNYARKDRRIKVIHKKHGEVMSARKKGLGSAVGQYVSFVDSDDWMEPDFYNIFIDFGHDQLEGIDIILMSGYQKEEGRTQRISAGLQKGVYGRSEIQKLLAEKWIIPCLWLKVFKRELIKRNIGWVDNHVIRAEDRLCSYICLLDAQKILVHDNLQYHYVRHASASMRHYREGFKKSLCYYARIIKEIRRDKNACFMDRFWNQMILDELMHIIYNEFQNHKLLLCKKERNALRKKFRHLSLSRIMVHGERIGSIQMRSMTERIILILYSLGLFGTLNVYIQRKGIKPFPVSIQNR